MPSPKPAAEEELPAIYSPNARLGMILFLIYFAAYAGFIGMAVFALPKMAEPSPVGVNWGLLYGLALIVGAFLLAVLYMFMCKGEEPAEEGAGR